MSDSENSTLSECASRIGYEFHNPALLRQALIHRSWQAENSDPLTNERFEFLGDAVLGWVIADVAFHRLSDMPEGKLTDLRRSVAKMQQEGAISRPFWLMLWKPLSVLCISMVEHQPHMRW